jgi:hypothetical protein
MRDIQNQQRSLEREASVSRIGLMKARHIEKSGKGDRDGGRGRQSSQRGGWCTPNKTLLATSLLR